MLSTTLCAALSPWRQGSRLCSSTHLGLGKGCSDSEGWWTSHTPSSLETRRETWDPLPIQPLLCPWLWNSHLPSSPGHCSGGPGYLENLETFPTLVDTAPSLWGRDGGVDLGCQRSPAPGHVYRVEEEESAPMMRADPWAKDKAPAPQARGKEGRQSGKVLPTLPPLPDHGDSNKGDGVGAGLTGSHRPHTCTHTYSLTLPTNTCVCTMMSTHHVLMQTLTCIYSQLHTYACSQTPTHPCMG